jgi:putative transposase
VQGQWKYLYRAVDKGGDTVDFLFRAHRDKAAAQRYFEKSIDQNGAPGTVTVDKSGSNLATLQAINAERETPIKIRQCKYLNNIVEVRHEVAYRSCSHFSRYRRSEPPVSPGESRSLSATRGRL